jgi:hypothetical protein
MLSSAMARVKLSRDVAGCNFVQPDTWLKNAVSLQRESASFYLAPLLKLWTWPVAGGRSIRGMIVRHRCLVDRQSAHRQLVFERQDLIFRHGRTRPDHPCLFCRTAKTSMPGTRPGMTKLGRGERLSQYWPLLRLWHDPDIGFWRFPALRIDRLGLVVGNRAGDNDVLALLPVGRRRDAMLRGHL